MIDQWTDAESNQHHVFSFNPQLTRVEAHSPLDGALVSTISIPGVNDLGLGNVHMLLETLSVERPKGSFLYFDLETQQWLPRPEPNYRLYNISADRRYVYYCRIEDGYNCKVYDRETAHCVGEFAMPLGSEVFRLDDGRLVETSDCYGYSVRFLDFATGKTLREIRPLGWVLPGLFGLIVLYGIWCVLWMHVSAREHGWAWIDVVLVLGLPALIMILRTALRGDALDLTRPPTRHALGIVMAGEMISMVWIVYGKTRLSLRIVPMLVATSLLMVLLTGVFGEKPWIVWHATKCGIVPAVCFMVADLADATGRLEASSMRRWFGGSQCR